MRQLRDDDHDGDPVGGRRRVGLRGAVAAFSAAGGKGEREGVGLAPPRTGIFPIVAKLIFGAPQS